jgi:hypothetical protein
MYWSFLEVLIPSETYHVQNIKSTNFILVQTHNPRIYESTKIDTHEESTLTVCHMIGICFLLWTASVVIVIVSSAVDCGFEPQSFQTKDFKIGIFCNSVKHTALGERAKDWLTRIRIMCLSKTTCLPADLFQWASTIKI